MPYSSYEESVQDGQPVELYTFMFRGTAYRYTSADKDVTFDTQTYIAAQLERSEIQEVSDLPKNNITIRAPRDFEIAQFFNPTPPSEVVPFTLREFHNTDGSPEAIVKWQGRVLNVDWSGSEATLTCENIFTSLKRQGLRRLYQRQCPHILYGAQCGLDSSLFRSEAQLTSGGTVNLVSPAFLVLGDDYLAGGYMEWERTPGVFERRAIRTHVGDTIQVTHAIPDLTALNTVRVYPGCDHMPTTCIDKFDNLVNYGGFPYIPEQNPFGQNSVF